MGQRETANHAKHGTNNMKKRDNGRSYTLNRKTRTNSLQQLTTSMIVITATVSAVLISIYLNLAWLQLFWLEVVPSLWSLVCDIFTPRNLFIMLNVLILSILALTHLQTATSSSAPSAPSQRQSVANDHDDSPVSDDDINSGSRKLKEDDIDIGLVSSADYLQQVNNVDQPSSAIFLEMIEIKDNGNEDYNTEEYADASSIIADHILNRGISGGNISEDDEVNATADHLVMKELIAESTAHLQLPAVDKSIMQLYCSSDAEEERKAEKASEKATMADDTFIDSLLAEKESIFTPAHKSRPLASARLTRKKAQLPNDRPLSPLRTILKRGDTLEATWKAICESKTHSSPFNCHYPRHSPQESIHDGVSRKARASRFSPIKQRSKANGNMLHDNQLTQPRFLRKREPSMPQEELNAKVESFISRFNAQIKIQREKSLLEFMEMVHRGAS